MLFLILACAAMYGISRADVIAFAPQHGVYRFAIYLIALAIPGPLVPQWNLVGYLILMNAIGWLVGLTLFGMASVGALPLAPLVLLGFALSFWPRPAGMPTPWTGLLIALIGGMAICMICWGEIQWGPPA